MKSRRNILSQMSVKLMKESADRAALEESLAGQKAQALPIVQQHIKNICAAYEDYNVSDVVVVLDGVMYMGETYYGEASPVLLAKYKPLPDFSDNSVQCYYAGEELEKNSEISVRNSEVLTEFRSDRKKKKVTNIDVALQRQQKVLDEGSWNEEEVLFNLVVVVGLGAYRNGERTGSLSRFKPQSSEILKKFSDKRAKCYWRKKPVSRKVVDFYRAKLLEVQSKGEWDKNYVRRKLKVIIGSHVYQNGGRRGSISSFDPSQHIPIKAFSNGEIQCYWPLAAMTAPQLAVKRELEIFKDGKWSENQISVNLLIVVGKGVYENGIRIKSLSQINLQNYALLEQYSDDEVQCYWMI